MTNSRDCDHLMTDARDIAERAKKESAVLIPLPSDSKDNKTGSFRLAHYASLEAVTSMLQSPDGGLRLSDSSTMNDPEEGCATRDGRSIRHVLIDEFEEDSWLRQRYDDAHVCCFVGASRGEEDDVEPGDDLLFWRLYGNECRGLSITLASHHSERLLQDRYVHQVTYAPDPPLSIDVRPILKVLRDLQKLRTNAIDADVWESIYPLVLPACDLLMSYRFLHKRAHYSMERECRAIVFVTGNNHLPEDNRFSAKGYHVQYQRIRKYVQIPQLSCNHIFTTDSRITIGANVPESDNVKKEVDALVSEFFNVAPSVVSVRVSKKQYRSR